MALVKLPLKELQQGLEGKPPDDLQRVYRWPSSDLQTYFLGVRGTSQPQFVKRVLTSSGRSPRAASSSVL